MTQLFQDTLRRAEASHLLLAELSYEMLLVGLDVAAILDPCVGNAERANALFDIAPTIQLEDRGIHLRFACRWLGEAFAALAGGQVDEAERWLEKASADLERYRRGPTEASFAAVEGSTS